MDGPVTLALLSPGRIGPLELKNRVIMAPMTTRSADAEGCVTEATLAWYRARAEGGVGLVTVEMAAPERAGKHRNFELGMYDDRFLPGLSRLVEVIHQAGAKASIQLGHGGGHTRIDIAGVTPIAPSAIPHSVQEGHTEVIIPEEMTQTRIAETVAAFAEAAQRAERAGFDAVEIHGAHGYLLSQFMTPGENLRTDGYGGSLENRARFSVEITAAVKAAVPDLAVIFRMNGDDFYDQGIGIDEAEEIAALAAEAGADAIHVTGGHYRSQPSAAIMIPPMATEPTPFLAYAQRVRGRVAVPVIAVGRFSDPAQAEAALSAGRADFIALGRPLVADPDWLVKTATGSPVRRCLACNSCVDGMREGQRLHCIVNPVAGREGMFRGRRAQREGQRIAVIGGGPAGLAYAGEMARANDVTLFERASVLGGALRLAGLAPLFQGVTAAPDSLLSHVDALADACRARGGIIHCNSDPVSDPALLAGFDHVVVATGARYPAGSGGIVRGLLTTGLLRHEPFGRLIRDPALRDWFYYKARRATGQPIAHGIGLRGFSVEIIGDAGRPGKTGDAVQSAFAAAYGIDTRRPAPA